MKMNSENIVMIRFLVDIITGHFMGISEFVVYSKCDFCRSCLEDMKNLYATVLPYRKSDYYSSTKCRFRDLECLKDLPLLNLLRFYKNIGWFHRKHNINSSEYNDLFMLCLLKYTLSQGSKVLRMYLL